MKTTAQKSFLLLICLTLFSGLTFSQNEKSLKKHSLSWQSKPDTSVKDTSTTLKIIGMNQSSAEPAYAIQGEVSALIEGGTPPYKIERTTSIGTTVTTTNNTVIKYSGKGYISIVVTDSKGHVASKTMNNH